MIELKYVITNGYVDEVMIENALNDGWNFVCTVPAKLIHPHALETDKATILSKYHK
ncbi:hypothetical protein NSS89_01355 [Caldifermentibacillus hisashii]|jgi:hypothetical protein|uniref:hypothetical protein n=1 Tax=Caldifermentibacillus hisashii TaxID=996558 RepID=UPI0031FC2D6A